MFNTRPFALQRASTAMKVRATQWMMSIVPNDGTDPRGAMQIASDLKPDVIYFLSDGEFSPLSSTFLSALKHQKTIVNTLAFEDPAGGQLMADIAHQTGGNYRFVLADNAPTTSLADLSVLLTEQLINELHYSKPETRRQAHAALVSLAGDDLGPAERAQPAELEQAINRWLQWGRRRLLPLFAQATDAVIVAQLQSPGRIARWGAATTVEERRLKVPKQLIAAFDAADRETIQVIRRALTHLSGGIDYGPIETTTDDAKTKAIGRWKKWLRR